MLCASLSLGFCIRDGHIWLATNTPSSIGSYLFFFSVWVGSTHPTLSFFHLFLVDFSLLLILCLNFRIVIEVNRHDHVGVNASLSLSSLTMSRSPILSNCNIHLLRCLLIHTGQTCSTCVAVVVLIICFCGLLLLHHLSLVWPSITQAIAYVNWTRKPHTTLKKERE